MPAGRSLVHLDGDGNSCRRHECNFGNLIADAIVKMSQQTPDNTRWATVVLGIMNGGGIRASIDKNISRKFSTRNLTKVFYLMKAHGNCVHETVYTLFLYLRSRQICFVRFLC